MLKAFGLTVYFSIWFCSLAFLAWTSFHQKPFSLMIFGFAIVKAALCAKFMLIAQMGIPHQNQPEERHRQLSFFRVDLLPVGGHHLELLRSWN
jgi:hypothetical protein